MRTQPTPMITWLDPYDDQAEFPGVHCAMSDPNGLLAAGGSLTPTRILNAYRQGIFPWYNQGQPILWWSPNPRAVLFPKDLKISRSLRKTLRNHPFTLSFDKDFRAVMSACAQVRQGQNGTWISAEMTEAYCNLHKLGHAHSVEVWRQDELVGGLYGVAIGKVFFGESMFYRSRDASKIAFVHLTQQLIRWQYELIDCQVSTAHLYSLGATEIPRDEFIALLSDYCLPCTTEHKWEFDIPAPCLDSPPNSHHE